MKNVVAMLCIAALACVSVAAAKSNKEVERLEQCGEVLKEILNIPDDLPKDLLNDAECVIVFPSVKKIAIGVGGSYGRGAIVCRSGVHFTGPWGRRPCLRWRELTLGSNSAGRQRTLFSWS